MHGSCESVGSAMESQAIQRTQDVRGWTLSSGAQRKIQGLSVSPRIEDLRVVIALVDYNPRATCLDEDSLRMLEFASQIDLFYLGFGMWKKNAVRLTSG